MDNFIAINGELVLAGYLCVNGHNALQKFSAAMELPPAVTPKGSEKLGVSIPYNWIWNFVFRHTYANCG